MANHLDELIGRIDDGGGLRSLGRIERGGDKPFHTVIKAENYHALQLLNYTHAGKVDVIQHRPALQPPGAGRDR